MTPTGTRGGHAQVIDTLAQPIEDTETAYYAPREGDLLMLGLLLVVVLGTGGYTWHQLGGASTAGRAIFFGLLLFCVLWTALIYTVKLSFGVIVGPHGISINRGPWRTELAWSETARLVERTETTNSRHYRWVVAMAYDTRRLQVREDMVGNYETFRQDVYLRFRNWQDHGGTWGTTASGPFTTQDEIGSQLTWRLISMVLLLMPGFYFWLLVPGTEFVGSFFLAVGVACGFFAFWAWWMRQTYSVDNNLVSCKRPLRRPLVLRWRAVTKVDRVSHPFGWLIRTGIVLGNVALEQMARNDSRVRSFPWAPRVPEYLILRGAGHQVRVRLHRLAKPDELLAWVEFYENIGRYQAQDGTADAAPFRLGSPEQSMPAPTVPAEWSDAGTEATSYGQPADPWAETHILDDAARAEGRGQGDRTSRSRDASATQPAGTRPPAPEFFPQPGMPRGNPPAGAFDNDSWLSDQDRTDAADAQQDTRPRGRTTSRPMREVREVRETQPPTGYMPISRPNFETERHYATSAPGSEPTDDDDAWLRETEAHLRASRPGTMPAMPNPAAKGPQPPAHTPPQRPQSPPPPSRPAAQPRDPDAIATRPGRPRANTRPTHPQEMPRPSVPSQPAQPYVPQAQPPSQPLPQPPSQQPMPPFAQWPSQPSQPLTDEHGDDFDQPTMDFHQAPPPQLPRFGPGDAGKPDPRNG